MQVTVLDGPVGTQLAARGFDVDRPGWSASAIEEAPELLGDIHASYGRAGATVHTACTFRTRARSVGDRWARLATRAVTLCREAVPSGHRVAGSLAPLEDCYRPDLSPPDPGPEHRALARVLAGAGCDLLLVETFPHVGEALAAVDAAVGTGVETWLALTAGPSADLLTPDEMRAGARAAVALGATAVLVNCVPATHTGPFVEALAGLGVPFGAYANAGHRHEGIGWGVPVDGPERYGALAASWVAAGATLVGGCCGTGPDHIRALRTKFGRG